MKWYHYLIAFLAGLFLANGIPHFIHGISGDSFPTPFADPPGHGLSSPLTNVLWGGANFLVGGVLLLISKITARNKWAILVLFAGVMIQAIRLSTIFADKMK
jgi:uncharacterized membrane protein